jgi:hypothetical protein
LTVLVLLQVLLVFTSPLATYLLALGTINRRRHPLLVPGTWDFVGLLCGVSGFVLAGNAVIWGILSDRWRMVWLFGDRRNLHELGSRAYLWFDLVALAYFLTLAFGIAWLVWRRRSVTVVYNVEPAAFEEALARVLDGKGLSWTRTGRRYFITFMRKTPSEPDAPSPHDHPAVLDLELSPVFRSVVMNWQLSSDQAEFAVRQEMERELGKALKEVRTRANPVAGWLFGASGILWFLALFAFAAVMVIWNDLKTGGF